MKAGGTFATRQPGAEQERVNTVVGSIDARVGKVHVTRLEGEGQVSLQSPIEAGPSLQVKFKGGAQVWVFDVRCRDARADVHERRKPRRGHKLIAHDRGQTHYVGTLGVILAAAPKLTAQFEVTEKTVFGFQQLPYVKGGNGEVVRVRAAQGGYAKTSSESEADVPIRGCGCRRF